MGPSSTPRCPTAQTLVAGANTYTITNTVTCATRLTLTKTVVGGTTPPTAWTLTATAPAGAVAGPTGTTGVNGAVTAGARYVLSETGGDPRYVQQAGANAVPIPGSTISWSCVQTTADGNTVIPGFADGLNGGVTVPLGTYVRCTAVNETVPLTLIKNVINDNGGTSLPAAWSLTATPIGTVPAGLTPETVTGSTAGVTFNVRPGQQYSLSEAGPAGYAMTIDCVVNEQATTRTAVVTLTSGQSGVCTFTNDDVPAKLTLTKIVANGTTGDRGARELDAVRGRTDPDHRYLPGSGGGHRGDGECRHLHAFGVRRTGRVYRRELVVHRRDGDRRPAWWCR